MGLGHIVSGMETLPAFIGGLFLILLLTSFTKVFTVLSIVRVGVGLEGLGMGAIVAGFSLLVTFVVMQPQLEPIGGLQALLEGKLRAEDRVVTTHLKPFLERNADASVRERLAKLRTSNGVKPKDEPKSDGAAVENPQDDDLSLVTLAFMLTELREAFELGLLLLLPFVVIDLLVVNIITALGVTDFPARIASLPLKLLLFVSIDGWTLITEKLLGGY